MPSLTNDALEQVKSTYTAKFLTELKAKADSPFKPFTLTDTYGESGYVPGLLGGLGSGQEWTTTRLYQALRDYGIAFHGKRYENSVKATKAQLADSPVLRATNLAAEMAATTELFEMEQVYGILKANPDGFDGAELFGDHDYTAANETTVIGSYNNDIAGTEGAPKWFLLNSRSVLAAVREGEDFMPQVYGGPNTNIDFDEDSIAFGWRSRRLYAPGFWANSIRSAATLTGTNVLAAMHRQAAFKNDAGKRIGARSTILVVPPELEADALALRVPFLTGGATNPYAGLVSQVIVAHELSA